ncbi:MAG TPA: NfeD family protein [Cytophagales bacterium]|nr:NfeD family protein [Cytophagales bacterium]
MLEIVVILVLLVFGLLLIFAEVIFVPGTTFVGLIGVLFSGVGIYLTFSNHGVTAGWIVLAANVVLLTWAIVYGLKANVWKRFSLQSSIDSRFNSETQIIINVGDIGQTISDLRPIGKADFNNQVIEVKTLGNFVKAGVKVKVIKLEPNNIFVETLTN